MNCNSARLATASILAGILAACQGTQAVQKPEPKKSDMEQVKETVAGMVKDAAVGKNVTSKSPPSDQYPAGGLASLVDGRMGTDDYEHEAWMGWWYEDKPFDVTIDLGKEIDIHELGVHALTSSGVWILYPRKVEFEVSSDGKKFELAATVKPSESDLSAEYAEAKMLMAKQVNRKARYVRVRAERYGELPQWHDGHGGADGVDGEAWLFIDEIVVNPK